MILMWFLFSVNIIHVTIVYDIDVVSISFCTFFFIGFVSFLDRCLDLLATFSRALTEKEEKEETEDDEDENEDDNDRHNKADSRKSKRGNHLAECLTNCTGMLLWRNISWILTPNSKSIDILYIVSFRISDSIYFPYFRNPSYFLLSRIILFHYLIILSSIESIVRHFIAQTLDQQFRLHSIRKYTEIRIA